MPEPYSALNNNEKKIEIQKSRIHLNNTAAIIKK